MPRGESETTIAYNLFHFYPNGNNPFSVSVVDLTFVGNTNIEGKHLDGTDITLQGQRGLKNNYLNVMEFAGANVAEYDAGTKNAYVESVTIKNVDIKGFYKGMRFEHVVSALVENVTIDDCFGNGIENVQSHLTLKDVEIGRVGAFGVEVTSDDMRGVKNPSVMPSGTAGRQYNETSTIKYEGFFKSNNYNKGASTVYMQKLGQEMGFSIADLVKAAAGNIIYSITSDAEKQVKLNAILDQTIKNEEEELNFSTLVFINPGEFTQYLDKGNTENKFCEFNTTEKINVKTLLENYLAAEEQGQEYDITEKKHLIIDLAGLDLGFGVPVNLGQIILVNMAYQAK